MASVDGHSYIPNGGKYVCGYTLVFSNNILVSCQCIMVYKCNVSCGSISVAMSRSLIEGCTPNGL